MTGNDVMTFILRSPWHALLSKNTMVVTLTGCKTGRQISLPVNYYREGNTLWVISTRSRTWWRNVRSAAPVMLRLQGRDVSANAVAIEAEEAVHIQLLDYLRRLPGSARWLHIRSEENEAFNAQDFAHIVHERLFIKFQLADLK